MKTFLVVFSFMLATAATSFAETSTAVKAAATNSDVQRILQIRNIETLRNDSVATIRKLTDANDLLQSEKLTLDSQNRALNDAYRKLQTTKNELQKQADDLKKQRDDLQRQIADAKQQLQALAIQTEKLRQDQARLAAQNADLERQRQQAKVDRDQLTAQKNQLAADNQRLGTENEALKKTHADVETATTALREEKARLTKELDWKSLLVKIISGTNVAGILAALGFFEARRKAVLENRLLEEKLRRMSTGSDVST